MDVNPENYAYHRGLQCCLLRCPQYISLPLIQLPVQFIDLTAEQEKMLDDEYSALRAQYPHAAACRFIPLYFATPSSQPGSTFETELAAHLKRRIRKAASSTINELKPLYNAPQGASSEIVARTAPRRLLRMTCAERVLTSMEQQLKQDGRFDADDEEEAGPHAACYVLLLQGQHLDIRGDHAAALAKFDEAIEHTPTNLDVYMAKARCLKHAGDVGAAAEVMDEARKLDLADRYVNSKATKYLLRANQVDRAAATIALFTKTDGEYKATLADMQCMWYELERGEAHLRLGEYGPALKQFHLVSKHFKDICEDQFDFHTYCLRKMTLRPYVRLLRLSEELRSHRFFIRGAKGAVAAYLALNSRPKSEEELDAERDISSMTAAEKKRWKKELRMKAAKRKKAEEAAAQARKEAEAKKKSEKKKGAGNKKKGAKEEVVDDDPNGDKLAATKTPLEEAAKFSSAMQLYGSRKVSLVAQSRRVLTLWGACTSFESRMHDHTQETQSLNPPEVCVPMAAA